MRNEKEILEFVEAVFRREHLREEFARAAGAADRLCEGLPTDAIITVLSNYRSFLEETAARLDVAEQTVSALLPEAQQLLDAEQSRESNPESGPSASVSPSEVRDDGLPSDSGSSIPAHGADASLFSEETAVVDVSSIAGGTTGQTAFYNSAVFDAAETTGAAPEAAAVTDAALEDLAGSDLFGVDEDTSLTALGSPGESNESDAHWSEVPDSAVIADTLSPDSPIPVDSASTAEAAAVALGMISDHHVSVRSQPPTVSKDERCGIREEDVMSILREGEADAVTAIVPRTTLEGVGRKRASDFWGRAPNEEPIRAPELSELSEIADLPDLRDLPDFDEEEGDADHV